MEINHKNKSILNSVAKKYGIKGVNEIIFDEKGRYYLILQSI